MFDLTSSWSEELKNEMELEKYDRSNMAKKVQIKLFVGWANVQVHVKRTSSCTVTLKYTKIPKYNLCTLK